jgi:threonine/homoserine/homoserine lactone efflux protein
MLDYFLLAISGMMLGYFAAIPIGPVNLICIRRTLHYGPFYGFVSGLGAALGDGVFASITAFGFTALAQLIVGNSNALQLCGGVFLIAFGVRTFFAPPPPKFKERLSAPAKSHPSSHARAAASTFMLTISNPATLVAYTALIAGAGVFANSARPSFFAAAFVVFGVFLGSSLWWLTLTTTVGLLHARINDTVVRRINEVSGLLVTAFGVVVLVHLARSNFF